MMRRRVHSAWHVAILGLAVSAWACSPAFQSQVKGYPNGLSDFTQRGEYGIDPKTILATLDRGGSGVFGPSTLAASPTPYPPGAFPWRQTDYLKVAAAVHQYVWSERVEDLLLYSMEFLRGCEDNPRGFDSGALTYFKPVNGLTDYLAREIVVYPVVAGVSWGGGTVFPRPLFGWKSIDLGGLKVSADDALQMAEANGGAEARERVQNRCTLALVLKPNGDISDWIVFYDSVGRIVYEVRINPYTGHYQVVPTSQW